MIAIDTETHLIAAASLAPRLVCVSHARDDARGFVEHRNDARDTTLAILDRDKITGQNIAYDFGVLANQWPDLLPRIFDAYDENRIHDTMLAQKLTDIADGCLDGRMLANGTFVKYRYNLDALAARYGFPEKLDKETWRLRYSELTDTPVTDWPPDAIDYAATDARATWWVASRQPSHADLSRQCRAAWALHLVSAWGLRTDRVMVDRLRAQTIAELESHKRMLLDSGLLVATKSGFKREQKKAQEYAARFWVAAGIDMPLTEGGKPSLDADAARLSCDPILLSYSAYSSATTALAHVEELAAGVEMPIHSRFDSLRETGRTSSSNPNVQNRSTKPGDRECFVPRKGRVFVVADFDGLELRTVAQVCLWALGESRLAKALNADGDPHAEIAALLLRVPVADVIARKKDPNDKAVYLARQAGKIANFGLAGGLGWKALVKQARIKYGVKLDESSARALIEAWHTAWPEFRRYFDWISALVGPADCADIVQFGSRRVRGAVPYTVACNSFFQGLGADATKHALYRLVRECYVGSGVLAGCRVVNFVHDEYIVEVPEEGAHECAEAIARIVTEAANEWLPDVPTKSNPIVCRRWSKLAKPVRDAHGRLIPWEWDAAIAAGSKGCAE